MTQLWVTVKLNGNDADMPLWRCSCGHVYGMRQTCAACERSHAAEGVPGVSGAMPRQYRRNGRNGKRGVDGVSRHHESIRFVKREG